VSDERLNGDGAEDKEIEAVTLVVDDGLLGASDDND
jgi:hypothetical protein